jgi:hypothetical protein
MYLDFDWKVLDDQYGSDHFSLLLKSNNSITDERRHFFKFRKADWKTFFRLCSIDLIKNEFNFTSTDIAETFSSALHTIACKFISLTKHNKSNKIKKHGLTMKVKKAVRIPKPSLKKFEHRPTTENLENLYNI